MSSDLKRKRSESIDAADQLAAFVAAEANGQGLISDTAAPGEETVAASAVAGVEDATAREERLRKSREKARVRRNRKRAMIEQMQENVVALSKKNAELKRKNDELRSKIVALY
eukprot:CAMPEP_0197440490 /NCGR_PEP_ID=MMETSP1175-20131217/6991_1 /TAXON_ID=1003142 /ORGANISM="Triceratium dubium, Strain CCMP147" /LENGTH=112 /DNA_ID=CAMNT_0042970605 /DNA_START=65 /DNA_END=403 /DNA_ORIENTATION=-